METITHEGKIFTKATILAKKHRYTTDYIGQLCRAGKVESKLIGRAWFVNEDALLQHKSERYSSIRLNEIMINNSAFSDVKEVSAQRRSVMPVLSKNTHRSIRFASPSSAVGTNDTTVPVKITTYQTDFSDLKPGTRSKKFFTVKPIRPQIPQHNTEIVKSVSVVLGEKAKHDLSFEPLPAVFLQGKLAVQSLDDPDLYVDTIPVVPEAINFTPKTIVEEPLSAPLTAEAQLKAVQTSFEHRKIAPRLQEHTNLLVTQPAFVSTTSATSTTEISEKKIKISFLVVPVFILLAVLLCGGLFSLSSVTESDGLQFRQSLKFNLAAIGEVFEKLPESY